MSSIHSNLTPTQLGPFHSLVYKKADGLPWVVLLHGYGANAADLAPLADFLLTSSDVNWAFIQGRMEIPIGPHMTGYAWFPIDENRLIQMSLTGKPVSLVGLDPPAEFYTAAEQVTEVLNQLDGPVILGGFSQGSMLSIEVACTMEKPPLALALLSSSLADKDHWTEKLGKIKSVPFFQSHGRSDNVLSLADAQALNSLLNEQGLKGEYIEFDGGHEIPPEVLSGLNAWLQRQLSSAGGS